LLCDPDRTWSLTKPVQHWYQYGAVAGIRVQSECLESPVFWGGEHN